MSYKSLFFDYGSAKTHHDYTWLAPRIFELVPAVRVFVTGESSRSHLGIAVRSYGHNVNDIYGILDTLDKSSVFGSEEMIASKAARFDGLRSAKDRLYALISWAESASVAIKEGVNFRDNETLKLSLLDSQNPEDRPHFWPSILQPFFTTDKSTGLLSEPVSDQAKKLAVATRPIVYFHDGERYTLNPLMIYRTRPIGASSVITRHAAPKEDSDLPNRFRQCEISDNDLKPIAIMLHSEDAGDNHNAVSAYRDRIIDLWSGFATENGLTLSGPPDVTSGAPPQDEDEAQWGEWHSDVGGKTEEGLLVVRSPTEADVEWGPWRSNTGDAEQ
ncbi:hypothetical protein EHS25_008546 [Saitozyma podzolica]|uniref:Uncharacterized protein n=1 Tax=Saitozyma podzolica TaxID=1890683 RepID=A0A427YM61_9TREE|nr:hypothetical protein EHS25_008546 [Saitozyma podzolica]